MRAEGPATSTLVLLALVCVPTGARRARAQSDLVPAFTKRLESARAELVELRRDIHRHPETSGNEVSNPEKGIVGMPHSPGYAADDEAIFVGARAMAAVLLDFLGSRRPPA
jgi:metal-dependent amidase/aminoacylase/carboxypeptidase family protein